MALVDDIARKLAGEFLDDAADRVHRLQIALNALHDAKAARADTILAVSREVHSLKGSAASFGFPLISQIAARFEDFISQTADREALPVEDMQTFAERLADVIEARRQPLSDEVADILRGLPVPFEDFDPHGIVVQPGHALVVTQARALGRMLARELANCGYRARIVSDPFDAMRQAHDERPDVILTSAMLDAFSGVDLIRALLGMRSTFAIPKAVVTSFDANHAELKGLPKGVSVVRLGSHVSDDLAQLLTDVPARH